MSWRTVFIGSFLVILGFFAYVFWPAPSVKVVNYPSLGTDIVAFGDSLVAGIGAEQGNDFVSVLSKEIDEPIVNLGASGDTTAEGLARINILDSYHPKVVLLLLGGDDAIQNVPTDETFQNLAEIIKNIQSRGSIVLLLGVRGGVLSDPFASQFEQLSKTYGTAFVPDVLSGLFGNPEYMSDDVHPNDAGYAIIATRIEPVLKGLLQ